MKKLSTFLFILFILIFNVQAYAWLAVGPELFEYEFPADYTPVDITADNAIFDYYSTPNLGLVVALQENSGGEPVIIDGIINPKNCIDYDCTVTTPSSICEIYLIGDPAFSLLKSDQTCSSLSSVMTDLCELDEFGQRSCGNSSNYRRIGCTDHTRTGIAPNTTIDWSFDPNLCLNKGYAVAWIYVYDCDGNLVKTWQIGSECASTTDETNLDPGKISYPLYLCKNSSNRYDIPLVCRDGDCSISIAPSTLITSCTDSTEYPINISDQDCLLEIETTSDKIDIVESISGQTASIPILECSDDPPKTDPGCVPDSDSYGIPSVSWGEPRQSGSSFYVPVYSSNPDIAIIETSISSGSVNPVDSSPFIGTRIVSGSIGNDPVSMLYIKFENVSDNSTYTASIPVFKDALPELGSVAVSIEQEPTIRFDTQGKVHLTVTNTSDTTYYIVGLKNRLPSGIYIEYGNIFGKLDPNQSMTMTFINVGSSPAYGYIDVFATTSDEAHCTTEDVSPLIRIHATRQSPVVCSTTSESNPYLDPVITLDLNTATFNLIDLDYVDSKFGHRRLFESDYKDFFENLNEALDESDSDGVAAGMVLLLMDNALEDVCN